MVDWNKASRHFGESIKNVTPKKLEGMFSETARRIGTFILLFLGFSGGCTAFLLYIGVNPTLILSVLGAPVWILYVLLARKLTNVLMKDNDTVIHVNNVSTKEESSDKH
jgi:hypothetical protein